VRLYLDDDLDSNTLMGLLRRAGHEVVSPRAAGTRGATDEDHLGYATTRGLVLLTANASHFLALHGMWRAQGRQHAGILIVYRENDPTRDMTPHEITAAVMEIERSGVPLAGFAYNLNFWKGPRA
jgi:hypothetical protein